MPFLVCKSPQKFGETKRWGMGSMEEEDRICALGGRQPGHPGGRIAPKFFRTTGTLVYAEHKWLYPWKTSVCFPPSECGK